MSTGGGDAVGSLVAAILVVLVPLVAVATIAMAIVEAVKSALWIRARVHRRKLTSWVGKEPLSILLYIATGGEWDLGKPLHFTTIAWSFLNQEGKLLFRQLKAGIDIVLGFPYKREFESLYDQLTKSVTEDAQLWKSQSQNTLNIPARDDEQREAKLDAARRAAEARQRVTSFVHHRIDALEAQVEQQWAWWNQLSAVILGGVILFFLSDELIKQWGQFFGKVDFERYKLPFQLAISLLGGLIAPFMKDLVNTLTGLRTKP